MQGTEQDHGGHLIQCRDLSVGARQGMVLLIILCEQCAEYLPGQ